jgi:osmotically-inducible protein OsmY
MQTFESLERRVTTLLAEHPHLRRRPLRCEAQDGRVVLQGVVPTWYQKQLAQEALRRVEGVYEIDNRLVVEWT